MIDSDTRSGSRTRRKNHAYRLIMDTFADLRFAICQMEITRIDRQFILAALTQREQQELRRIDMYDGAWEWGTEC